MPRPIEDGAHQRIARQLVESVDRLQKQVDKVEFWATAVTAFTQPIPDYEPGSPNAFRHVRPASPPEKVRKKNAKTPQASKSKVSKTPKKTKKRNPASAEPA